MRVLVTGGTGYLGAAIVRALAARGHTPVVFARRATAALADLRATTSSVSAVDGDIRDREAVRRAVRGCDAVCHTAALVSQWRPRARDFDDVNVGGLRNILEAARDARSSRIVYTSSFLARPPAGHTATVELNDYQRTKVDAERVAREAADRGAPIAILYPGVVYGPGQATEGNLLGRLLRDHLHGRLPGLIGADRIWSFAWVDDVAAAHAAALDRPVPAGRYELGGDNAPQIRPFELALASNLWTRPVPRRLPYWFSSLVGLAEENRARLTGRAPLVTRGSVNIFRFDWPLDHADAARDLGYVVTSLASGLPRVIRSLS